MLYEQTAADLSLPPGILQCAALRPVHYVLFRLTRLSCSAVATHFIMASVFCEMNTASY
jgi:hypothetical protein